MQSLKRIRVNSSVSSISVTLYARELNAGYVIKIRRFELDDSSFDDDKDVVEYELYEDYFRAQYRFLQLAMHYLS